MDQTYLIQKKKEYEELLKSEKEIKESLKNFNYFEGNYKIYGLVDHSWYQNYKTYLSQLLNGKRYDRFIFNKKEAEVKLEKKMYYRYFSFNFLNNFELVTQNFITLLFKNYGQDNPKINAFLFYIIIGGECIIIRDSNKRDIYITYYEDNKSIKLDFWLLFEDEKQKKLHLNLILTYNLWHYLGIINFNYNDEKKDIFDCKGKKIGFFFVNCDEKRSKFLDSLKKVKLINSTQYQQVKKSTIINIELIPKIISALASLSLFNEFKNELFSYSKDNRYQIVKLFVNFFMKFPNMNHDNETRAISGLLIINADMNQTLIEIVNLINEEYLKINSIKESNQKVNAYDEN